MSKSTKKQLSKIVRKKMEIRNNLFPDLDKARLWDRLQSDGWLSVPRTMPLLLRIMDLLATKGKPVGQTYFDLWCRTYDDSFVIIRNPSESAYFSGFTGERAVHTWASRIKTLNQLGFIESRPGVSGKNNYIILFNPYIVIKEFHEEGKISAVSYNALLERSIDIGSKELTQESQ